MELVKRTTTITEEEFDENELIKRITTTTIEEFATSISTYPITYPTYPMSGPWYSSESVQDTGYSIPTSAINNVIPV